MHRSRTRATGGIRQLFSPSVWQLRFCTTAAIVLTGFIPNVFAADLPGNSPNASQAISVKQPGPQQIRFVRGHILVQPRAGLSEIELDKVLHPHGGRRAFHIKEINVHVIELSRCSTLSIRP